MQGAMRRCRVRAAGRWVPAIVLALALAAGCAAPRPAAPGAPATDDTARAARAFVATFNGPYAAGDLDALAARFAPDVRRESPTGRQLGREEVRGHYERLLARFRDPHFEPLRLVVAGDTAVCECRGVLVQRSSGKRLDMPLAIVLTFDAAGRVTRYREYFDTGEFRRQLQ